MVSQKQKLFKTGKKTLLITEYLNKTKQGSPLKAILTLKDVTMGGKKYSALGNAE